MPEPDNTKSADATTPLSADSNFSQALSEFQLMLRYALAEGLELGDKAQQLVANVSSAPDKSNFSALMDAHTALSKIVAPATPRSIEATEPY